MMNLQGPNYAIDAVMPTSLRNSSPGYVPTPNGRIRIYEITLAPVAAGTFTLTDGAASNPLTLESVVFPATPAPIVLSYNPPLEVFDFKVTALSCGGQVTIKAK